MWASVPDQVKAEKRQLDLEKNYLKDAMDQGANIMPHKDETDINSARSIISLILKNTPRIFQIVDEMVNQKLDFSQTSAGQEINKELSELQAEHAKQIITVQKELQDMKNSSTQDKQSIKDLSDVLNQLKDDKQRYEEDAKRLRSEGDRQKTEHMQQMQDLMAKMALKQILPVPASGTSNTRGGGGGSSKAQDGRVYLPHGYMRTGSFYIINHGSDNCLELTDSGSHYSIRLNRDVDTAIVRHKEISWRIASSASDRSDWTIKATSGKSYASYVGSYDDVDDGTKIVVRDSSVKWNFRKVSTSDYLYRITLEGEDDRWHWEQHGTTIVLAEFEKNNDAQHWKLLSPKAARAND